MDSDECFLSRTLHLSTQYVLSEFKLWYYNESKIDYPLSELIIY